MIWEGCFEFLGVWVKVSGSFRVEDAGLTVILRMCRGFSSKVYMVYCILDFRGDATHL